MASVIRPPNVPRLGSAATGASAAATPGRRWVSRRCRSPGLMPGLTVGGRGGGTGERAPLVPCPPVVKNAAAATTAATNASTANPTSTWVDFRQRVGPITLLTVWSHSAESAANRSTRVDPQHLTSIYPDPRSRDGAIRRDHRDPERPAEQVRGRSRDGPGASGPLPLHLDGLPDRLRVHRGHPR